MRTATQRKTAHTDTWHTLMKVISDAAAPGDHAKLPLILTSLPELPEQDFPGPPISFIHGPPGRNIALAIGLGAALPDTPLLLIMNADAVTLGMNHLIHAARRNMGMTLLILRSEVTDAVEKSVVKRTNWHSYGFQESIEKKATPLELATSLEASSVSRGSIDDVPQLTQLISAAMAKPGFSMIGITSENRLPRGILSHTDLPEYFESYRRWSASLRQSMRVSDQSGNPQPIVDKENLSQSSRNVPRHEIKIAGIGGQGVKLAGSILSDAAGNLAGLWTTQRGSYGSATRGGPSVVDVVAGSRRIGYPGADNPDVLVVLNENSLQQFADSVKPSGYLIVDSDQVTSLPAKSLAIPIVKIAVEFVGKPIAAGIVSLGCIAAVADFVSLEALKESIALKLPRKMAAKNIDALVAGYTVTRTTLMGE